MLDLKFRNTLARRSPVAEGRIATAEGLLLPPKIEPKQIKLIRELRLLA